MTSEPKEPGPDPEDDLDAMFDGIDGSEDSAPEPEDEMTRLVRDEFDDLFDSSMEPTPPPFVPPSTAELQPRIETPEEEPAVASQAIPAPGPTRGGHLVVTWCITICALLLGGAIAAAPLEILLDRFMPDDAFYFFKPAWNVAATGVSTFDGIHPTNGYQPLWFLLCIPVFWVFPDGGELPIRLLVLMQLAFYGIGTALILRALALRFGALAAGAAMVAWLAVTHRLSVNGLETAVLILTYGLTLTAWLSWFAPGQRATRSRYLVFGVLCGLVFLARLDSGFLVLGLCAALLLRQQREGARILELGWFALPLLLLAGGYLVWNLVSTGHLMPVSGAAKQYHSSLLRAADAGVDGDNFNAIVENFRWLLDKPYRHIAMGLAAPWALLILSFLFRGSHSLRTVRRLWPFYFGATAACVFYCTVFHGSFSQTGWYYVPQVFCAALAIAAVGGWLGAAIGPAGGVLSLVLVAYILNWPAFETQHWQIVGGAVVAAAILGLLFLKLPSRVGELLTALGLIGAVVGVVIWDGPIYERWLYFSLAALVAPALFLRRFEGVIARQIPVALVLVATTAVVGNNLRAPLTQPPGHWNYNLYLGALWARDNLPEDATIWSGSTGILGYFSERSCVNTDGLANSFEFLEDVLSAGKLPEYLQKWDYAIDAFGDDSLAGFNPNGEFVELPVELQQHGFQDGELTRSLRVFRMDKR